MKDLFDDGYVDHAIFQPAYLGEFYNNGFGQTEEAFELDQGASRQADLQPQLRPAQRRGRPRPAARGRREVRPQGRQALHRRVARRVPRLEARRPVGVPLLRGVPRARHHEHPRAQGPDDPAAGPRRLRRRRHRPRRHRLHRPELHRRALSACRGWRTSAGSPPRSRTCYGGLAVAMPFIHTRPRYFAQIIGELLYWIGEDRILFSVRLRDLDAAVADRAVRRLPDPRGPRRVRADHHRRRRRRSSGSTPPRCTTSRCPPSCSCRDAGETADRPARRRQTSMRLRRSDGPRVRQRRTRGAAAR